MEIPRLHREIHDLEEDLECMTRSRNWYKQRYSKFISDFREHDIPLPFHPKPVRTLTLNVRRAPYLSQNWRKQSTPYCLISISIAIGLHFDIDIHLKQCRSVLPLMFFRVHAVDFSERFWIYPQRKLSANFHDCRSLLFRLI
jgi:hypothetical protein